MTINPPVPYRGDIRKTPGRVVWRGVSLFSKMGSAIERSINHEQFPVGTDMAGELDHRTREYHGRVRFTPDGRFGDATNTDIAAALWPYNNYTTGQAIFPSGSDYPLAIHSLDDGATPTNVGIETFVSAALDGMPALHFTPTDTAIGQCEWLCLRADGKQWSEADSFVTQAASGGSLEDASFSPLDANRGILTGPYYGVWGPSGLASGLKAIQDGSALSVFDTLDGIRVEFNINWASDDIRQATGLINRRIRSVGARIRCSPVGATRQSILNAQIGQGAQGGVKAVRGRSALTNAATFYIVDPSGKVMFALYNASLSEDRQAWGTDAVRETDLVWVGSRKLTAGVPGALFDVLPSE